MTWVEHPGLDVTGAFVGVTSPTRELMDEVHRRGWTATVKIKDHSFVAVGQNPHKEKLEAMGMTEATAVGNLLSKIMRREHIRRNSFHIAAWDTSFEDQLQAIAQAYAEAPIYEPKAASAWIELAGDCQARAETLQAQLHVEVVDEPNPYKTADELRKDVREKKHIYVSQAHAQHPVWSIDQMIAFRLVHDVLGHVVGGGDWGWHGANQAFAAHAPLLSPEAQKALFTETLGQAAYQNIYRDWGPQKIAFLDDLIEKAQEKENKPGHAPTHPSQALAPAGVPDLEEKPAISGADVRKAGSNTQGDQPLSSAAATSADSGSLADPNDGWSSGVDPLPDNAYLWQRDPSHGGDPLDSRNIAEMAYHVDPGLANLPHSMAKQAVANAFRSVLLSPRKSQMHGAQHYQHVMGIPADVDDPMIYWQALEEQRRQHNINQGLPDPHTPYERELGQFRQWVKAMNPRMDDGEVHAQAQRELLHMLQEEEERVLKDDPQEKLPASQVEMVAYQNLQKRIKAITKPRTDEKTDYGNRSLHQASIGPYGSYLASHVRPLVGVSRHINPLTTAALEDLHQGGSGHHFRQNALNLTGLSPRVVSQAWRKLHPHGSQLAVLDPHVMETLGHDYQDLTDRDYFKHERELAAGRDASGYGHVPLGQFSWGMHDLKTGGPGFHQDHSPTRAIHPTPWEQVDWPNREVGDAGWPKPYWWESTKPARDGIGSDWDKMIAVNHPQGEIPYQHKEAALNDPAPSFDHPDYGSDVGAPGESLMQFLKMVTGLSMQDIWALEGLNTQKVR